MTRLLTVSTQQLSITHRHSVDDDTTSSTHCHTQRLIVVSEQVTTRLLTVSTQQLSITHRHSVDDDTASGTHCHTQRLTAGDDTPSDGLREAAVNHTQT